jgi:hypothetical protein
MSYSFNFAKVLETIFSQIEGRRLEPIPLKVKIDERHRQR